MVLRSGIVLAIGFYYMVETYFQSLPLRVFDDQKFLVIARQQVTGFQYLDIMPAIFITPGDTQVLALNDGEFVFTVQVAVYRCVVSHCCCVR